MRPSLLPLLALAACAPSDPGPALVRVGGTCMGTQWTATLLALPADVEGLADAVQAELDHVDAKLSTWKDTSDLSRLAAAPVGEAIEVAPVTLEVLALADRIVAETGGAFDPTVGPLVELWGFHSNDPGEVAVPSDTDVEAAHARVRWDAVEFGDGTARRTSEGVEVDLSAIAKGAAVDRAASALEEAGCRTFFLEVGGEVVTRGRKPDGRPWRVGIVDPTPPEPGALGALTAGEAYAAIDLVDRALATSGDYRNVRRLTDGTEVTHTVDPRTGRTTHHMLASITVLAPTCGEADALATAALVLGPEAGLALLERLDGVEGIGLVRTGDAARPLEERSTSGAPALVRRP